MLDILVKPLSTLAKAKKERNLGNVMMVLLVASVLFGLSKPFFYRTFSGDAWGYALLTLLVVFVVTVILGFLVHLIFGILIGKHNFYNAITPLVFSAYILGVAMLVSSIVRLLPWGIGSGLSTITLLFLGGMAIALNFRGYKDFYGTDFVTVLVMNIVVLGVALLVAAVEKSTQLFLSM